jgi:hypothetical protein
MKIMISIILIISILILIVLVVGRCGLKNLESYEDSIEDKYPGFTLENQETRYEYSSELYFECESLPCNILHNESSIILENFEVYQDTSREGNYISYVVVTFDLSTLTPDEYDNLFETELRTTPSGDILWNLISIDFETMKGVGSLIDTDKKWYWLYDLENHSSYDDNEVSFDYTFTLEQEDTVSNHSVNKRKVPSYENILLSYHFGKEYYEVKSFSEMDENLMDILLEIQQNYLD